jgi:hypothetical protein
VLEVFDYFQFQRCRILEVCIANEDTDLGEPYHRGSVRINKEAIQLLADSLLCVITKSTAFFLVNGKKE